MMTACVYFASMPTGESPELIWLMICSSASLGMVNGSVFGIYTSLIDDHIDVSRMEFVMMIVMQLHKDKEWAST